MDLDFEDLYFLNCLTPTFLDFPGPQISKFPDFQVPKFPDAAGAGAAGRTLRSQLDPSPNAPRDQIRCKEPLLRQSNSIPWQFRITVDLGGQASVHGKTL